VPLPPQLETAGDRIEQLCLVHGLFLSGGASEKAAADFGVPADVVPAPHLILEEPRQQETLRSRRLHDRAVIQRRPPRDEAIVYRAEIRRRCKFVFAARRDLCKVGKHAGVVQQLVVVDRRLGHVPESHDEELQCPAMIVAEELLKKGH
jgi:hypothetical protein